MWNARARSRVELSEMPDAHLDHVATRSPRLAAKLAARTTPALDAVGAAAWDLARYYALLERERPGALVTPEEACLIRDALPALRAARRDGGRRRNPCRCRRGARAGRWWQFL